MVPRTLHLCVLFSALCLVRFGSLICSGAHPWGNFNIQLKDDILWRSNAFENLRTICISGASALLAITACIILSTFSLSLSSLCVKCWNDTQTQLTEVYLSLTPVKCSLLSRHKPHILKLLWVSCSSMTFTSRFLKASFKTYFKNQVLGLFIHRHQYQCFSLPLQRIWLYLCLYSITFFIIHMPKQTQGKL